MLNANPASNFWTAVAQCREAFWAGHSEAAQRHITTAAHLAGLPLAPDGGGDKNQKIDLLEQLAALYKLDLKLASVTASNDDKAFDHISPDGMPGKVMIGIDRKMTMQDDCMTPERSLRVDPSRAELLTVCAAAHRRLTNDRRAHLLLRRACASGFAAREAAQQALASWIEDFYTRDQYTGEAKKTEAT